MKRFTFYLVVLVAVVALAGLSGITSAEAAPVQVSQESGPGVGDFDANVLGFVEPYVTGLTVAQFYQYGNPFGASYNGELNGGPDPISSVTQVFLVDAADGLSLVVVHDRPVDGSGGVTRMQWDLVGDTAGYLQGDDPGEGLGGDGVTSFTTAHGWAPCCTDGFVVGSLEGGWSMFGAFRELPTGILRWAVTDNDDSLIGLVLEPELRVRLAAKIEVGVDIKPGSCPNPLNPNSQGSVPVAVIGTKDFDPVAMVDPSSLTLAGVPMNGIVEIVDSTEPHVSDPDAEECYDCFDAPDEYMGDGYDDLVVKFDTQALVDAIARMGGAKPNGCVGLVLEGATYDGIPIFGGDAMLVRKGIKGIIVKPAPGTHNLTTTWGSIKSR